MLTPAWLAATPGYAGQAGQVNQFLGTHAVTCLYQGNTVAQQTTLGSGANNSSSTYLAQSFNSGSATAIGQVVLYLNVTGTPPPVSVALFADSGGPAGAPLASTPFPKEFTSGTAAAVSIPLPAAVTPSTTYWLVLDTLGDGSDYFAWFKSNQTSGASTSPDGVTWTAQAYGFYFKVLDQSPVLPLAATWEDSGARWTSYSYTSGQLTGVQEFTAGQTAGGYTAGKRALTYSGGLLTKVA